MSVDEEIRGALVDGFVARVADCVRSATGERKQAAKYAETHPEQAAECLKYAAYDDRQAAHFRQAIDLLKAAPMPASEEAK